MPGQEQAAPPVSAAPAEAPLPPVVSPEEPAAARDTDEPERDPLFEPRAAVASAAVEPEKAPPAAVQPAAPSEAEVVGDFFALGEEAMASEDFSRAAELFERAITAGVSRERACHNLALCREALGDREAAIRAYERLAELSDKPRWRQLARSRGEALKRRLGQELLYRAECVAEVHQWRLALEPLGRATALHLPASLDQRARMRYYQAVAQLIAESVVAEATSLGYETLAVADVRAAAPEFAEEVHDFRRLLRTAVHDRVALALDAARPSLETVDWEANSESDDLSGEDRPYAYEPALVGTLGEEISMRLVTGAPPQVMLNMSFARKGAVPPVPTSPLWGILPKSPGDKQGFDIEVWAGKETAKPKTAVEVDFRPSRDAFVAVYRVLSDGKMEQVFPSSEGAMQFVRAGETVRVDPQESYNRLVMERVGVEGFWALATTTELSVRLTGLGGVEAAQGIRDLVTRLPADRWASSSYRVRVSRPPGE